jgi:DNA-binding transcriptional LysR family regulator
VFALFLSHGLGEIAWTAVDSLTAQKRLVEAGLGIALLAQSHVADELRFRSIATIAVGDLRAQQHIVAVTRRGGFLSAASQRLLEIIRQGYASTNQGYAGTGSGHAQTKPAGHGPGRPKGSRGKRRALRPKRS